MLKDSRTTTVAETTMLVRGRPTAGHLQAVQPQEVARPAPDPVPPVARLAVVAGRPGPRQPRASRRRRTWRSWRGGRTFKSDPLFWFLPHETYLITVKEEPAVDLATYVSEVLPACRPSPPAADPPPDRVAGPPGPIAPRAFALAPRSEGLEHPDPDRYDRRRGSAQPDRPGRGSLAASAALEASRPEPGASVHQPGRRSRAGRGPMLCNSSAFISPGAYRR